MGLGVVLGEEVDVVGWVAIVVWTKRFSSCSHATLLVALPKVTLYSTYTSDLMMVGCSLLVTTIGAFPILFMIPLTERLVSLHHL